jgi:2-polyprenyl-3-methyl-5-hydroxy-6-metoxy-1,4-benzoquinol methylase
MGESTQRVGHWLQPRWDSGGTGYATIEYRYRGIENWIRGRDVLDLGGATGHGRPDWIHAHMASVAKSVVGIDLDEEKVERAREDGYDFRVGNVESVRLARRFDAVFAGEIIEHLVNFEGMFETARVHAPDGVLLLTTPNAFAFTNFIYRLGKQPPKVNEDHTCWFCEDTLCQLIGKCGFEVIELRYLKHRAYSRRRQVVASTVRRILPDHLAWSTIFVVARPSVP